MRTLIRSKIAVHVPAFQERPLYNRYRLARITSISVTKQRSLQAKADGYSERMNVWFSGGTVVPASRSDHDVIICRVNPWDLIHIVWACCLKLTDGSQFVTTKISPVVLCLIVLKEAGLSRESSQTDQCCRQTEEPIHSEHGFTAGTMVPAPGKPVVNIFYSM